MQGFSPRKLHNLTINKLVIIHSGVQSVCKMFLMLFTLVEKKFVWNYGTILYSHNIIQSKPPPHHHHPYSSGVKFPKPPSSEISSCKADYKYNKYKFYNTGCFTMRSIKLILFFLLQKNEF